MPIIITAKTFVLIFFWVNPIWLPLFLSFQCNSLLYCLHPSSIRQDSNPQPLDYEPSTLTTRPWLLAIITAKTLSWELDNTPAVLHIKYRGRKKNNFKFRIALKLMITTDKDRKTEKQKDRKYIFHVFQIFLLMNFPP